MNKFNIYLHNYNTRKQYKLVRSIIIIQKYIRRFTYKNKFEKLQAYTTCAICLENIYFNNKCLFLENCQHIFHKNCINTWIRMSANTCPICRTIILKSNNNRSNHFCDCINQLFYIFFIFYLLYNILY
jgi:hypothetical protein